MCSARDEAIGVHRLCTLSLLSRLLAYATAAQSWFEPSDTLEVCVSGCTGFVLAVTGSVCGWVSAVALPWLITLT